ncbi:MAG TPA: hypothetical protein VJR05_14670, partial [Acidimicrobiia bacterium]|nr:hypothetical protein [Acidimicrobiia bacterium]
MLLALLASCGCTRSRAPEDVRPAELPEFLEAHCADVAFPIREPPDFPPVDGPTRGLMVEVLREFGIAGEEFDGYTWLVAERTPSRVALLGQPGEAAPREWGLASIVDDGQGWTLDKFGVCRVELTAPGFGNARFVLNPEIAPDPASPELAVLIMERACASGQPPVGREIRPVVTEDELQVTVVVLVEPVQGGADCPGNPWHPVTIELEEALGDRMVYDGSTHPPWERTWP